MREVERMTIYLPQSRVRLCLALIDLVALIPSKRLRDAVAGFAAPRMARWIAAGMYTK